MKNIILNDIEYDVVKDDQMCLDVNKLKEKCTDYFTSFDYILGDYAYNHLRLKGFYDSKNPNCKAINNIDFLDDYLKNYCAYGCSYFLLKKNSK